MPHLVIGTAGHIDHGKSALVRALTNSDPDRLKEEKARGITIDLGFAHTSVDGMDLALVDVPGHERFVKNMLAGVTGIDAVMLVVSAEESVMPQTREHFDICRLLALREGIVVLTKADLVDRDTIELVSLEVRDLVAGTFLERAPIIAASSLTGQGLDEVRAALTDIARRLPPRRAGGVTRLPVDRVFSARGFGTVVTGTLTGGHIGVDDELVLLPGGRTVKVRGLQGHGVALVSAEASQRLAVNLSGIDAAEIARGATLAAPGAFVPTRILDASIDVLESARPLKHGARVRFHFGTSELLGRVALSGVTRSATATAGDPAAPEVPPGGRADVRVRLEAPAVVTRGDHFILRAYSPPLTIAGGVVLDPAPPRGAIRTPAGRKRFAAIAAGDPGAFLRQLLAERAGLGLSIAGLVHRAGLAPAAASAALDALVQHGEARRTGTLVASAAALDVLGAALLEAVAEHHRQQPLSDGLPREEARTRVFARADPAVFETVVDDLVSRRRLSGRERLALPGVRPALSEAELRASQAIADGLQRAGLLPPDAVSLGIEAGATRDAAERSLALLLRQKVLVKIDALVFHASALERLKAEVRALKGTPEGAALDVAAFKQRYGMTRKYAIPLLEYLDRERVTRRAGEKRVVI